MHLLAEITNLLSVTVFLGMVSEITPPTSESIPIIAVFFSLSMLILGCSIIATLVIINVHFRSPRTHQMGKWMFRKTAGKHVVLIDDEENRRLVNGGLPHGEKDKAINQDRLDEEDRDSDLQADWKFMAMVIDRFSLFLFTVLIIATTSLIFLSTPRLFVNSPVY
ncbi:unnamed protein product [Heligmosomoides polygyrus]|uniref:Neur_chan_memb domain-containing protein n=1 Tax=Heligmosomoides polygyrus TaxID=6339 RepID=A0A183GR69_HELPZ|nr:unnamed protein product [Heligmosomoides polygyrus]